jgi:F0F1-type ATP synthase epsilon subunit
VLITACADTAQKSAHVDSAQISTKSAQNQHKISTKSAQNQHKISTRFASWDASLS